MNRISTAQIAARSIETITSRQAEMSKLQQQIATGRKLTTPADDPAAADATVRQHAEIARLGVEKRMVDFAKLKLEQSEGAIGEGVELFQRVRELLLGANNDTQTPGDRALVATELRGLRTDLLHIANRSDGLGAYVFGGAGTRTPPFVEGADGVKYVADAGTQMTGQERTFATSTDGSRLFEAAQDVSGHRSIFAAMDQVIGLLEGPDATGDPLHEGIASMIADVDRSIDAFNAARATVGEQMGAVDRRIAQIEQGNLVATERLADLTEVDFAEAISALSSRQTGLEAAMQTYAQISGLSLFNYIR